MSGPAPAWFRRTLGTILLVAVAALVFWVVKNGGFGDPRLRTLGTQVRLLEFRLSIDNYWKVKGSLPEFLEDVRSVRGFSVDNQSFLIWKPKGERSIDTWQEPLRYAKDADGMGYEVRSAGPDGKPGNADDVFVRGRGDEDVGPVAADLRAKSQELDRLTPRQRKRARGW